METSEARFHNIRVASRVMGWTQWTDLSQDCPSEPGVTYFADWGGPCGLSVYMADNETGDVDFYFDPAEDIADAFKVLEKFAAEKNEATRHSFKMRLRWAIEDRTGDNCSESEVILRVKPQDICVAAVSAVERDGAEQPRSKVA